MKNISLLMFLSGTLYSIIYFNLSVKMIQMPGLRLYSLMRNNLNDMGFPLLTFAYKLSMGILGSIFIITLFIYLSKFMKKNKIGQILASWGSLTLGIYLWQAIILEHWMMKTIN